MTHVTCKAYLTVKADHLPKYNQHRVITDGHCVTPKKEKARLTKYRKRNRSMNESTKPRCRETTEKSSLKGHEAR